MDIKGVTEPIDARDSDLGKSSFIGVGLQRVMAKVTTQPADYKRILVYT